MLVALAVATAFGLLGLTSASGAPTPSSVGFAPGSLIIPMDTDTSPGHAAFNQNQGMWKAYGLLYRLLQNGIPVRWAISENKTATTQVDFTVTSVKDERTGTALGAWDYRGGPFIIDASDAPAALPIIRSWWAANANQPNVHEALAGFSADVNVTLRSPPRIANEAINAGITIAYYNAAGIPDLNGNPWSTSSPNILSQAQIAAGGLFQQGSVCLQRKFDVFVTPHNGGYSYSLSDPTNLGTRTYAQLDTFVQQGGGWTALCHSILSNENAIAALTLNGSDAVKALFRTSQPGGKPGGFLTQTGFPTIDNTGGTWTVNPAAAGLPTAQLVPTTVAQSLPGGSVQTWPAPGNPGAPTYWSQTERVAFFDTAAVDHDHIISGTYHDGTGLGKLTYIGGHSLSTSLPYSNNSDAPYLRAFYNSLFFNGSAVAKLDLIHSPDTFPQNGTGPLSVSIANTGGSVATNVGNVSVTLAPGFTYAGTTAGPVPNVSLDGRTLTWIGGLGNIAGGATAVKFNVAVDASVSGTTGVKNLGQMHATYGDVFGEGFTADICRDITVTPVPAPRLTKTPPTQGPVSTGSTVTWTLSYGNSGAAALLGTVLEDRLPPGFAYVSSSSSPSLGAATVIPAPSGTIVRFNIGTLPANTASAGTVTINARAGPVTAGTGTPPQQTFTNNATLRGQDAGGNPFSIDASADVTVKALDITLGKTVDKTFLSPLPGTLTYTLTPRSDNGDLLDNVRVIDPVPTGVTSPVAGQGGTVGPYQPIPAVPGSDTDAGLSTAISVSSNLVTQGGAVTVTMNVQQTTGATVNNVSPSDITAGGISGGPASCTGPSPASASVLSGGAGTNFTWSCTLQGLGEYTFSGGASDSTGTTSWPAASSPSVLSTTGGGPNVVTWNLGSNTPAHGGSVINSGYTPGIYGLRGGGQPTFQKYDLDTGTWGAKANTLVNVAKGGALAADGAGTIYELTGNGTQGFNAYSIDNVAPNTWTARASTGTNVGEGGALVYRPTGTTKYVYALMGGGTTTFKRYDVAANTWATMAPTPANVKKGGSLATDGTFIYALQGGGQKGFWRYDVGLNTWTALTPIPDNVNWGGALTRVGNFLYATIGGGKNKFYRYDITLGTWTLMANTLANVADGGALTTDGTFIYAFRGKSNVFWRYNIATNTWTTLAPFTANTDQGGALVFDPGLNPQGQFSAMRASRSLTVTGDTVDVSLTLTSSTVVNNVVPGSLNVAPTGGASCSTLTGPVLTSADNNLNGHTDDSVVYTWTCTVAAGANPGSLTFSDNATGSGGVSFATATSNSVIVSPPLTFTVNVPVGAPNPVLNAGLLAASGETTSSPQVSTGTGSPTLTVAKSNSPGEGTTVRPGDPITYTMRVENTGSGVATGGVVTDSVPANTDYTSCSGGSSCGQSGGTVSWTLGTLQPGDTATVTFTVNASTSLAVSDTPYTISNSAVVDSDQTNPVTSNTVTNKLEVRPEIVKTVSATDAGPGDTLTYTLTVSNPGAPFTADITDAVPAGTTFTAGSCSPACSFASGTVTWAGQSIPHGTSTFTFAVSVNAGTGGSTVTNSGTLDPTNPDLTPIDSNTTETDIGPVLGIVKTNDPTGQVQNGTQITYTLVVSNESDVLAQGVVVSDPLPPGTAFGTCTTPTGTTCGQSGGVVTFQLGSVPGAGTVTVSFTVTVGTPPVGTLQIINQAQVSASNSPDPVLSNPVENPLPFPELLLSKRAAPATYDSVGDVIHYQYVVTNNSTTTTLAGPVTVTDNRTTVTCPPGDLAPLATTTCNATYTITQADLNAGSVTNTATAQAAGVSSNSDQATVDAVQSRDLTLVKTPTESSFNAVGDVLHYSYAVTNTGNVSLAGPVTISDDKAANAACPALATVGNNDNFLDPGETITCTGTYTVTQTDLNAGSVTNTATAHAAGTDSNTQERTVNAVQTKQLTLEKTATEDSFNAPGQVLHYSYAVTNTGNVRIAGPVTVADDTATVTCPAVDTVGNNDTFLDPGESLTCSATYTVKQADLDAGSVRNTATASAGGTDSNQDQAVVPADQAAHITLAKTWTIDKSKAGPTGRTDAGDVINYTLTATNDGNVTLTAVVENDPTLPVLSCTVGGVAVTPPVALAPGKSLVCTGSYTITQADLNAGSVVNTAKATGTDPNGKDVTDERTVTVPLGQAPRLNLVKSATETSFNAVGDVLHYSYAVTNTGNVSLAGPVTITDDKASNAACPDVTLVGNNDGFLDPGETITCTGTYAVTQADLNAGFVTNTATAGAGGTNSNTRQVTVDAVQGPKLTLVKTATETSFSAVDDVLHYSYDVTNTGNVSLAGPVTISDNKATDAACPGVNTVGNNDTSLDPGETITCKGTYTVTQTDLDAGRVTNSATAQADGVASNQDQAVVPADQAAHITLAKTWTIDKVPAGPPDRTDAGDVINYTLTATNDGNVTLTAVVENDPTLALDCAPPEPAVLAPGESLVCTGSYTIKQADINAGSVNNSASATGTDPNDKDVTDDRTVTVPLGQSHQLTLVKTPTESSFNAVGDILHYSYAVSNTGNVSLAGPVTITDDKSLNAACPNVDTVGNKDGFLDPGETITCTGTYTVTQADLNAGFVTNTATASADGTDSNTQQRTVNAVQGPELTLVKSATEDSYSAVGDVLHYSYTVTNTGNVSLAGPVTITDDRAPNAACPDLILVGNNDGFLDPGETITCSGMYTITQADLNAGSVTNTATAGAGGINSNTRQLTVDADQSPTLTLVKTPTETSFDTVGQVLHYSYDVTNDGNVSLAGTVTITDDKATDASCPALTTVGNNDNFLDPGETITCSGTYTVTQADLNAGSVTNTATASAGGTDSNTAQRTVDADQKPALTLAKQATEASYNAAGQVLHYTYTVTNTGNVRLAGPVTITDDLAADAACPALTTVGNNDNFLDPGETITCNGSYTVTQDDVDTGRVTNTATAHAAGTDSEPDDATVDAAQHPGIRITKSSDATPPTTVGNLITFTFLVKNTGNETILSYTVIDQLPGISAIDCTGQPTQLAPGDTATCHATYTVTQADVDAGQIVNIGTVHGKAADDTALTDSDAIRVPLTPLGTLQVVKQVVPSTDGGRFDLNIDGVTHATDVGDGGRTPAVLVSPDSDHSVSESAGSGTDLGDYTSATACTRNGSAIPNLDPAHITVGLGDAVVCTITNTAKPASLAMTKSAPAMAHDGDSITYVIKVSNTGAVPLRNLIVTDQIGGTGHGCQPTLTSGDTNRDGILDTTEAWIYSCTYTVEHGDEDATHHIVNVARVTATNASGQPVGPVEASASTLITHPAISLAKTGPGTAHAGESIVYTLAVRNVGDTNFAEATVTVADPNCTSGSLRLTSKGGDSSPTSLDPGETWTYRCSVQTAAGETSIQNSATARATDQFGTTVTAQDSAETRLTPGGPFTAKISGPTGCVYRSFLVSMRGQGVARVVFTLDGRRIKGVSSTRRNVRVAIRIRLAHLRVGKTHRLVARVTFAPGAAPKSKMLRMSFRICAKQLVAPQFTG